MTCIAVAKTKKGISLAGDRRCSSDMGSSYTFPEMKIRKMHENCLFGAAGDGALCQLIIGHFNSLALSPLQWLNELRAFLIENHCYDGNNRLQVAKDTECVILLILKDKAMEVRLQDSDGITTLGYDPVPIPYALGCGGPYAHAILISKLKNNVNTEADLRLALSIASVLSPGVDSNIDILNIK